MNKTEDLPSHFPGPTPRCRYHSLSGIPFSDMNPRSKATSLRFTDLTRLTASMILRLGCLSVSDQSKHSLGERDVIPISQASFTALFLLLKPACKSTNPRFDDLAYHGYRQFLLVATTAKELSDSARNLFNTSFKPHAPCVSPLPFLNQFRKLTLCLVLFSI
jgi:hypothetical protein